MNKTQVSSKKLIDFLNSKHGTELKASPEGVIFRKELFANKVMSANDETGECEAIITCEEVDRGGDLVVSSGINTTDFQKIPSVYISHNYQALPIAQCLELTHMQGSISAKVKFALAVPEIKWIWERIKAGVLRGVSIGFEVKDMLMRGTKEFDAYVKENLQGKFSQENLDRLQRIFLKWDLYEFSICGVPANQSCYIKSLPEDITPELAEGLGKYGYKMLLDEPKEEKTIAEKVEEVAKEATAVAEEVAKTEPAPAPAPEPIMDKSMDDWENTAKQGRFIASGKKESDFDAAQLAMGIEVEKEHTESPEVAKRIALDHLAELSDYYTRLAAMEAGAENKEDEDEEESDDKEKQVEPSFWVVVRTQEEVETYVQKAAKAKASGKLDIQF